MRYETYYSKTLNQYLVKVYGPMGNGEVVLTSDQYNRFRAWQQGSGLIQNMLYDLNKDDREILMTGIGPEQWDRMFKSEED